MKSPRLLLLAAFALALVALPSIAAAQASVTGTWQLTWETPRGEQTFKVNLTQSETTFTGMAEGPMGEMPVKDGVLDGNEVTFVIEMTLGRPGGGQTRTVEQTFKGVLADGAIEGTMEMPAMGGGGGGGGGRGGMGGPRPFKMTRVEG